MSGFLSSRYLKYRQPEPREKIERDLKCPGCGYNLRGLNYGGNCPECGAPIERGGASQDLLLAGSDEERAALRVGLGLAFACLVAVVVARLLLFVAGLQGVSPGTVKAYLVLGLIVSVVWTGASLALTRRGMIRQMRAPGLFVRLTQPLWVAAYVCWLVAVVNSSDSLDVLSRVLRAVAGIGAIVLAYMLGRMAQDAQRETAARRLNAVVWLLPVATLIVQVFPKEIAWFTLIPLGFFLLLWAWVMIVFALGVLELQRHITWAGVHTGDELTRSQRVADTRRDVEREVEAAIRPVAPPPPDIPLDPPRAPREQ